MHILDITSPDIIDDLTTEEKLGLRGDFVLVWNHVAGLPPDEIVRRYGWLKHSLSRDGVDVHIKSIDEALRMEAIEA